jgi:hypothetical protein
VLYGFRADTKGVPVTCPHCGRETGRRERFCDGCGAFLGWDTGQSAESQVFPEQAPRQEDQRAGVRIQIKSDLIEVAPGNAESTAFTVKNFGTQVEQFRFSVTGPDWLAVEPATMSVYPGQEATGTVQAAPPHKPSSAAGVTPFRLTVTSAVHAHVSSSAAGRVDVAPYHELAAELAPTSSHGRGWTRHQIKLDNRGNVPLRVPLNPTDVADGLRLKLPPGADVAPGEITEVPVRVHGPFRWFGRPEPKTFSVIAEAPKPLAPARLSGTRVVVPLLPKWVPVAAAALAAAGVAAAVLTAKAMAPPHGPGQHTNTPTSSAAATSSAKSPATSSSAPSSSASSSAPPSPVPVPDVTGETLPSAESQLRDRNLKPQPQASSVTTSAVPWNVVRTEPTASASASPGSTVLVFVPTGQEDLVAEAATDALWTATSQLTPPTANLKFGGNEADNTGAVFLAGPVTLESGGVATSSQALETHPPPLMGGFIKGVYTLKHETISGEQFRADIGFRKGTGARIEYEVIATEADGSQSVLVKKEHDAGSSLTRVEKDLPSRTTNITLVVTALDLTPASDDVIWVDPRIEEANASPAPLLPTVSPSASPRQSPSPSPGP